ncbi:hypothetical protein B0T16DRAFT_201063 [Cercophora newfieldiana]|uniref:SnoaL-like domain-containing protein n=1 Tax=Cercophora newfieldiana TaxID=92897 RepID=A0AA40CKR9_9PEZI|nr:hypothetical protein B0T16DRAFT_201063 [Cercophora newfieldiana]
MAAELHARITTTLNEFLNGYVEAGTKSDASLLSTVLSPTCTREVAPASFLTALGMPTDLAFTNKQYEAMFAKELPVSRPTGLESVINVVVDVISKTAAATCVYMAEFGDGVKEKMQFAWFLELDDEGARITKVLEFVDTMTAARYQKKVEELLQAEKEGSTSKEGDVSMLGKAMQ